MKSKVLIGCLSAGVLCGLGFLLGAGTTKPTSGPKDIPELAPLGRFVGSWEWVMTDPTGAELTGTSSGRWAAGGRVLLQEFRVGNDFEGVLIKTYDTQAKVYRVWSFDSKGGRDTMTGEWNGISRTFTHSSTSIADGKEITAVDKLQFVNDDTTSWSLIWKDKEGKVLGKASGTAVRKKN